MRTAETRRRGLALLVECPRAVVLSAPPAAYDVAEVAYVDHHRPLAVEIRGRLGEDAGVVAVGGLAKDRPVVTLATDVATRQPGTRGSGPVRAHTAAPDGGVGGRDHVAWRHASDGSKVPDAFEAVSNMVAGAAHAG
jgi:alanyl-tRNA synthetase